MRRLYLMLLLSLPCTLRAQEATDKMIAQSTIPQAPGDTVTVTRTDQPTKDTTGNPVLQAEQSLAVTQSAQKDEDYIMRFPGRVTLRMYVGEKASIFDLADKKTGRSLRYYPNNVLALGAGVTLFGLGINFSTSLPFHDKKEDLYGHTSHLDVQLHKYSARLMIDAYGQHYQGFHLNNLDDVSGVKGATTYPYFPNMESYTAGASALYVFNGDRFSMRSLVSQQDWQMKSAGSLLLGASFFWHQFKNDSSILPPFYKYPDFLESHQPRRINYYGLTINGGYGYTAVLRHNYFASGALDVGAGPGYSSLHDTTGISYQRIGLNTTLDARLGLGYNSKKWFGGLYVIAHIDRIGLPYSDASLTAAEGVFRVVAARRIITRKRWLGGR